MSTNFETKFAYQNKFYLGSTAVVKSSDTSAIAVMSTEATYTVPGFMKCTVGEQVQFPIEHAGDAMTLLVIYDAPCTGSTGAYPQVDVMKGAAGYTPAWGGDKGATIASSNEEAWASFISTAPFTATSTEAELFILGPIDTALYAQNFGGTSSNSIDKYQNFLAVMVGYSTTSAKATHDALSTNAPAGNYYIMPLEIRHY